jgi:hypothetical protein
MTRVTWSFTHDFVFDEQVYRSSETEFTHDQRNVSNYIKRNFKRRNTNAAHRATFCISADKNQNEITRRFTQRSDHQALRQNQAQVDLSARKKTSSSRHHVEWTQTRLICEALRWKRKHNAERQLDDEQKSQEDTARQMKMILRRVLNEKQTQRLCRVDVSDFQKTFKASRQFIQDWK